MDNDIVLNFLAIQREIYVRANTSYYNCINTTEQPTTGMGVVGKLPGCLEKNR